MKMIDVQELKGHPANRSFPRTGAEWREFVGSVKRHGVLQALLVRPLDAAQVPGRYEIVMGHRRAAAAAECDLQEVPCVVRELTEREALCLIMVENLKRRNLDPIEEAEGLSQLRKIGMTPEEMAEELVCETKWVQGRLGLLELPKEAREAVREQRLAVASAQLILGLPKEHWPEATQMVLHPTFQIEPLDPRQAEEMITSKILAPMERRRVWEANLEAYRVQAKGSLAAWVREPGDLLVQAAEFPQVAEIAGNPDWVAAAFDRFEPWDQRGDVPAFFAADLATKHGAPVLVIPKADNVEEWQCVVNWRVVMDGEKALAKHLQKVVEEQAAAESRPEEELWPEVVKETPLERRPWIAIGPARNGMNGAAPGVPEEPESTEREKENPAGSTNGREIEDEIGALEVAIEALGLEGGVVDLLLEKLLRQAVNRLRRLARRDDRCDGAGQVRVWLFSHPAWQSKMLCDLTVGDGMTPEEYLDAAEDVKKVKLEGARWMAAKEWKAAERFKG